MVRARRFCDCDPSEKALYSAFLMLVGIGYLMALTYLYTGFQGLDGKPGLSVDDIAENYYGNRSGTRLEAALRGPMSPFIDIEKKRVIISWLQSGASKKSFEENIYPIIEENCFQCHGGASAPNFVGVDLSNFDAVNKLADVDTGVSLHSLMRVSHIHLFGIGLVLLAVGMIFRRVEMREWLKTSLILLPFISIFIDILAWFVTKWDPVFAYSIVITGGLLGASLSAQILISLYQIWFFRRQRNT